MAINFYLDEFEEQDFKCKHTECPYKACSWHRYALEELDRYDYACEYKDVADMFPLIIEDVEICNMYLDQ